MQHFLVNKQKQHNNHVKHKNRSIIALFLHSIRSNNIFISFQSISEIESNKQTDEK